MASRWRCRSAGRAEGWASSWWDPHSLQPSLKPQVVAEAPLLAGKCALRVSGQAAVLGALGEQMQKPELWEALHTSPCFLPSVFDASGVVPLKQPGQPLMPVSLMR